MELQHWTETSHTYGKVNVPVVDGYYSDKAEAGSKTVTPEQPGSNRKGLPTNHLEAWFQNLMILNSRQHQM
ncbi:mucin-binding protein [Streptococcus pneumoniae]|uniref:mucin-binding protein n=1 Tax=Streptococcus pneumoniae TaxID=1313 RepID=UPI000B594927|nr:hypothetical protein [Streptococcus pneumoniae]SNE68416.1 MucBP domain protein [Streptococcus pneumoniae]